MNILLVMIPLSILLALGAGIAFFWAVDHDQFDDLDTPKLLPLLDDPRAETPPRREGETTVERGDAARAGPPQPSAKPPGTPRA